LLGEDLSGSLPTENFAGPVVDRQRELRARGLRPIPARIALARHACRLAYTLLKTQQPFDEQRYRRARHQSER
jgi:hypothetical protein